MEDDIPRDKDDLLRRIAASWGALAAIIAPLSETEMTARPGGQWSVKDNLAHLAAWEGRAIALLTRGQTMRESFGLPPDTPEGEDTSHINGILWERHKDDSLPEVLEWWRGTHAALLRALAPFTHRQLSEPYSGTTEGEPLGGVVMGNTVGHYPEHAKMITDVVGAQREGVRRA